MTFLTYLQKISKYPLLSHEEEIKLALAIRSGDYNARELMINSNLRLVVNVAKLYLEKGNLEDLVQDGNIGLIRAVEKYDPNKGYKFSTYAVWWIRQTITRKIYASDMIRLPNYKKQSINRIDKILQDLFSRGIEVSIDNISAQMVLEEKRYDREYIEHLIETHNLTIKISLSTPIGKTNGNSCLFDVIQDDKTITPYFSAVSSEEKIIVEKLLKTLKDKEEFVLRQRYGIQKGDEKTLGEVGLIMGLTSERIRQIEKKALKKLRARASI